MRATITLNKKPMTEKTYCNLVNAFTSEGYTPIIDPRQFDSPISIKARFKAKEEKVRFIEFSPQMELSIEHELTKSKAEKQLDALSTKLEELMVVGDAKVEDYELATLQMISQHNMLQKNPVVFPANEAEAKLFEGLEQKKIFSKAFAIKCPKCNRAFMVPHNKIKLESDKMFCVGCEAWVSIQNETLAYIVNEEYMAVIDTVWDKVQKLIRASWREVIKRGIPIIKVE
ncbi:MAG: hypothetical protein ABIG20_03580 [archaeon]